MTLRAPFPWFGGKRRVADVVWRAFGADVPNYVEPFAGSLAVLLGRPGGAGKIETVNDRDRYLANFWRAVTAEPDAVAAAADWPVNEADLHARHAWLVGRDEFRELMHSDPDHYDVRIAGWWVWGLCQWIGGGWCMEIQTAGACIADAVARVYGAPVVHTAYRPSRNMILLSVAASHAAKHFDGWDGFSLWIGACADDFSGFPDCRSQFITAAGDALSAGAGRNVHVKAPLLGMTKIEAVKAMMDDTDAVYDMQRSWSCYASGPMPCGTCTPCTLRSEAFAAAGVEDMAYAIRMFGGDPSTAPVARGAAGRAR